MMKSFNVSILTLLALFLAPNRTFSASVPEPVCWKSNSMLSKGSQNPCTDRVINEDKKNNRDETCDHFQLLLPSVSLVQHERFSTLGTCSADDLSCPGSSICAETSNGFRCVIPKQRGETCIHVESSVCDTGLECIDNICVSVLPENAPCDLAPDSTGCMTGTYCAGKKNQKRCVKPMNLGERCGDPYWICHPYHTCRNYMCVVRAKIDEDCEDESVICPKHSVCVLRGDTKRCTSLIRPDRQQWALVSANKAAWIFLNGEIKGEVVGWQYLAATPVTLNMGDVISFVVQGGDDWSGFIAAVGAYQVGKPGWAIRTGAHEFVAREAYKDDENSWMMPEFDICEDTAWKRIKYASAGAEVGKGMSVVYPYWNGARYMWARNVDIGKLIFVRFKRGGHNCSRNLYE